MDGWCEKMSEESLIHSLAFIVNYQQLTLYFVPRDNWAAEKCYLNKNILLPELMFFWRTAWANMWFSVFSVSKLHLSKQSECCGLLPNQTWWNKLCSLCRSMIYLWITHVSKFLKYLEILSTPVYLVSLNSICSAIFTSPHLTVVDQYYNSISLLKKKKKNTIK